MLNSPVTLVSFTNPASPAGIGEIKVGALVVGKSESEGGAEVVGVGGTIELGTGVLHKPTDGEGDIEMDGILDTYSDEADEVLVVGVAVKFKIDDADDEIVVEGVAAELKIDDGDDEMVVEAGTLAKTETGIEGEAVILTDCDDVTEVDGEGDGAVSALQIHPGLFEFLGHLERKHVNPDFLAFRQSCLAFRRCR